MTSFGIPPLDQGNVGPQGVPRNGQSAAILDDPRTYYRTWTPGGGAGGNTDENPIAPYTHNGRMSVYARAVAATPGLVHWWRFDKTLTSAGSSTVGTSSPPYFANSAGATTLRSQGAGTPFRTRGLIPGEDGFGCDLNGGYLDAFDYRAFLTTNEVMTAELWVDFRSLLSDVGLMGEWLSNSGWMLYSSTGTDLRMYFCDAYVGATGVLSTGRHHIVGVLGGNQSPTPDYYGHLYVDGVNVASGLTVNTVTGVNNSSVRFEIGNYGNGAGTHNLDGIVDEVAIYSRMLQPEEVKQHYQAAFARE